MPVKKKNTPKPESLCLEFIDLIPEVVFGLDRKLLFFFWNKAAEKLTGIKAENVIGKSLYEVSAGIHENEAERKLKMALESGEPQRYEHIYHNDNNEYIFEVFVYPVTDGVFAQAWDVTEQKKTERSLLEAEKNYKSIFENATEGIFQSTWKGEIIRANPALARMHGYHSPEELKEKIRDLGHQIYFYPERRKVFLDRLIEEGEIKNFEEKLRRKDGSIWWGSVNARLIKNRDGSIDYIEGTLQDITDRKRTEDELRNLNQRFMKIINTIPVVIYGFDSDGIIYMAEGSGFQKLRLKQEELIGISVIDNYGQEVVETPEKKKYTIADAISKTLTGTEISGTLFFNDRYIYLRMFPAVNESGKITGILGMGLDITDYKQTEIQLNETNRLLENTLDSLNEAVFVIDSTDDRNIKLCNKAAESVLGYPHDELIGDSTEKFHIDRDHYENFHNMAVNDLETKGKFQGEYKLKRKDGRIIQTEHTIKVLDRSIGLEGNVVSVVNDITERKKYIEQINDYSKRMKKLAAHLHNLQEEERARIARNIHDQIGQIFTVIKMNLSLLEKEIQKMNIRSKDKIFIVEELSSMEKLTDFSIENIKNFIAELRPGDLDHLSLNDSLEWLVRDIDERSEINIEFEDKGREIEPDLDTKVNVFRVVQEALSNILQHSGATKAGVILRADEKSIHIEIKDNGKGLIKENLNKNKSFGILGMRERIALLNGSFEINGEKNKGTKIKISIPLQI